MPLGRVQQPPAEAASLPVRVHHQAHHLTAVPEHRADPAAQEHRADQDADQGAVPDRQQLHPPGPHLLDGLLGGLPDLGRR